jgi:hypothetical protein
VALLLALPSEALAAPTSSAANRARRQRRQRERQRNPERAEALTAERREVYATLPEQEHAAQLQEAHAAVPEEQHAAQLQARHEAYVVLPEEQHAAQLQGQWEAHAALPVAQRKGVQGGRSPPRGEWKYSSISLLQSFREYNSVVHRTLDSLQLPAQEPAV